MGSIIGQKIDHSGVEALRANINPSTASPPPGELSSHLLNGDSTVRTHSHIHHFVLNYKLQATLKNLSNPTHARTSVLLKKELAFFVSNITQRNSRKSRYLSYA